MPAGKRTDRTGRVHRLEAFQFDGVECRVCPLRSRCIVAKGRKGRRVLIHPQEALLQGGQGFAAEHCLRQVSSDTGGGRTSTGAAGLGIRQSWYFGLAKTQSQLYLAATVANLTLVLGNIGLSGRTGGDAGSHSVVLDESALLSPMPRPISAPSGSDNYCP